MTELLAKYFSGNLSNAERQTVLDWRNANQQNAEEFFEYGSIWNRGEFAGKDKSKDSKEVFEQIILGTDGKSPSLKPEKPFGFRGYLKYAAAVTIAVVASYFMYSDFSNSTLEVAAVNGIENITLSDGSKVYLSKNSKLVYNKKFGNKSREVLLTGKAFFEVKRDENRVFVVRTAESEVRVLGTSFLVDSDEYEHETEVVVETGKVAISSLVKSNGKGVKMIELNPGEVGKVVSHGDELLKYKNENPNYMAWKSKVLNFDKTKLEEVFEVLEETYNIAIDVSNVEIYGCNLTATYDHLSIESTMEIVSQTFGLDLEKTGNNKFNLSGEGCPSTL